MSATSRRRINSPRRQTLLANRTKTKALLTGVVKSHADRVQRVFEDIVSDWAEQPRFLQEVKVSEEELRVTVRPAKTPKKPGQIFGWVDKGTKPYVIKPKRRKPKSATKPYLRFRTGYAPKTLPVARAHVGPGRASGPWASVKQVNHPGIRARLFSEAVHKSTDPQFKREVESAFRKMERLNE